MIMVPYPYNSNIRQIATLLTITTTTVTNFNNNNTHTLIHALNNPPYPLSQKPTLPHPHTPLTPPTLPHAQIPTSPLSISNTCHNEIQFGPPLCGSIYYGSVGPFLQSHTINHTTHLFPSLENNHILPLPYTKPRYPKYWITWQCLLFWSCFNKGKKHNFDLLNQSMLVVCSDF